MQSNSFYKSTKRERISTKLMQAAKRSYSYNYNAFLPNDKSAKIVDLGCSEGLSLEWLYESGFNNLTGVDSDDFAVGIAKKRFENCNNSVEITCSDLIGFIESLPENSVDMFTMFNVIEHIPKEKLINFGSAVYRALKKEGSIILQTGNMENPFNIGLFSRDITHHILFTRNSLQQMFVLAGFERSSVETGAIKYKTTITNFPLQIISPISEKLVKLFARSMRMRINETAPMIFCRAIKN